MAFDKKPSVYSDRSSIGAADELDAYGVWVKSEPQDLVSGLAMGFDGEAMPFEDDFGAGFDDIDAPLGVSEVDVSGLGADSADFDMDDFSISGYEDLSVNEEPVDEPFADAIGATGPAMEHTEHTERAEHTKEEISTKLLMKIADELSSIRKDFSTLRKEFDDIRSGKKSEATDEPRGGFFADEEKDSLTGDEIENILTSSELSEIEEPFAFDPLRDEDEAALSELSMKNETGGENKTAAETKEMAIDFDNLGINLNDTGDTDMSGVSEFLADEELLGPESLSEHDFARLDEGFNEDLNVDLNEGLEGLEDINEDFASAGGIDEPGELQELRLEGASPITSAPDNTRYLEDDPFAKDDIESEALSSGGNSLELNLDDAAFDINLDDLEIHGPSLSAEDLSEDISLEKDSLEKDSLEKDSLEKDSLEKDSLEKDSLEDISLENDSLENDSLEDITVGVINEQDLTTEFDELAPTEPAPDLPLEIDDFMANIEPSIEPSLEETPLEETPLEETPLEETPLEETPLEETPLEEPVLEESPVEEILMEEPVLEESPVEETPLEEPVLESLPEEIFMEEPVMEETPVEEPVLEESLLEETLMEEPVAEEPLPEETPLEVVLETGDLTVEMPADTSADDDSLAKVIPEALEINVDDANISFDDDLDAFSEEDALYEAAAKEAASTSAVSAASTTASGASATAAESGKKSVDPSDLKSELKSVLSYMENLLESLPEEKIEEFANSKYFETYKKIFKEWGLVQ